MRNWSDSPFGPTVQLTEVSRFTDAAVVARDNGESSVIYDCPGHPKWLVKSYKPEIKVDQSTLSRLIDLPRSMSAEELALVDRNVAWPVARVVDGYRTVGTIMAKASEKFSWEISLLQGRTKNKIVEVDLLANSAERIQKLGLPVPTAAMRLGAMREVVAVAALFERYDVVYGDWSFANAFWAPGTSRILIIDVDASGIGQRRRVETPNWEDPLMTPPHPLTTHTDRYKVALLVVRAVTGLRKERLAAVDAIDILYPSHRRLGEILRRSISALSIDERPLLAELYEAMTATGDPSTVNGRGRSAAGANVTGQVAWAPPSRRGGKTSGPPTQPIAEPAPLPAFRSYKPPSAPPPPPRPPRVYSAPIRPGTAQTTTSRSKASPATAPGPPAEPSTAATACGCVILIVGAAVIIVILFLLIA